MTTHGDNKQPLSQAGQTSSSTLFKKKHGQNTDSRSGQSGPESSTAIIIIIGLLKKTMSQVRNCAGAHTTPHLFFYKSFRQESQCSIQQNSKEDSLLSWPTSYVIKLSSNQPPDTNTKGSRTQREVTDRKQVKCLICSGLPPLNPDITTSAAL